jgi:hypothetical protein
MSIPLEIHSGFMSVVEFEILPAWFELDARTQRDYAKQVGGLMKRHPNLHSRWFDSDAWTGEFTDFFLCEFEDLEAYNEMWSEMRRHPLLATPYARIGHVLMGMELNMEGLSNFADLPEIEIDMPQRLERPPETGKPVKPAPRSKLSRPPKVDKPAKQQRDTDTLSSCCYCGHQVRSKARFCSRCGTAVHAIEPTEV